MNDNEKIPPIIEDLLDIFRRPSER